MRSPLGDQAGSTRLPVAGVLARIRLIAPVRGSTVKMLVRFEPSGSVIPSSALVTSLLRPGDQLTPEKDRGTPAVIPRVARSTRYPFPFLAATATAVNRSISASLDPSRENAGWKGAAQVGVTASSHGPTRVDAAPVLTAIPISTGPLVS